MAEHTPAPWRVGEYSELYGWAIDGNREAGFLVARVQADTEDHEEGAANARLIAAAPELLEAAKLGFAGAWRMLDPHEYEALGAAIRKAEGR
jgi:hypothetical protein